MVRYFLTFSYVGTQYRGVQRQASSPYVRNVDTIQGALEAALQNLLPKPINRSSVVPSSRTDAGVHALCNTAHVELENKYNTLYNVNDMKKSINRYFTKCGHTIRLLECVPVTTDFHARRSCKSRTYIYRFMIPKIPEEQRLPLIDMQHTHYVRLHDFDVDRARCGTELFMGIQNFATFSAKSNTNKKIEYVRALHDFTLENAQSLAPFDPLSENFRYFQLVCKAKSFLYNQVRRMVSALIALGQRNITEKDITVMLQVPSHRNWNPRIRVIPSNGLHLLNLEYNQEELKRCTITEEQHQRMLLEEQHTKGQEQYPISEEEKIQLQKLQLKQENKN